MSMVIFKQSQEQEIETIIWSIKNHKILEEFCNITIYPKLPKKLWQLIIDDKDTFENSRNKVRKYLKKTNQLTLQKNIKKLVLPLWKDVKEDFFSKIIKLKMRPLPKYICYLTQYGGGGSFNYPNVVWVRVNLKHKDDIKYFSYTVAHEIIHLLLYKKLKNQSQKIKEKIVDDIIAKIKLFKKRKTPPCIN